MDNLITLIFIIIAVLSVLGKIQPKKKAGTGSKSTGGWVDRLNTYLTDLQNKIEKQANTNSADASGWDEIVGGAEEEDDLIDADEYSLDDLELPEEPVHLVSNEKTPLQPVRTQPVRTKIDRPDYKPKAPDATPPELCAKKTTSAYRSPSKDELRRAVVWSEILGPPVALKDQSGNRR